MQTRVKLLNQNLLHKAIAVLFIATLTFTFSICAQAQQFNTLFDFQGTNNGETPYAGVTFDSSGNLFGTTRYGGLNNCSGGLGCGVAYEISPSGQGSWTQKVMYVFTNGTDGATPFAGLVSDGAGNFYGTAFYGGSFASTPCRVDGCGVVFEISPTGDGTWVETVLHTFSGGRDGNGPMFYGSLVRDSQGNLYGTTVAGGAIRSPNCAPYGCGVVFELSPGSQGWTETVLYAFQGDKDGAQPYTGVTFDNQGNIYGTTYAGAKGYGGVFRLSPSSGGWKETTLFVFTGIDGNTPEGPLVFDSSGNLYGTSVFGGPLQGCDDGCGLVFELTPRPTGFWYEKAVRVFDQTGPFYPSGSLVFDSAGNLYGTVVSGGPTGAGGIYKMSLVSGEWQQTGFFTTPGSVANSPIGGLISDSSGNLYGTTAYGGSSNSGLVFKFTP